MEFVPENTPKLLAKVSGWTSALAPLRLVPAIMVPALKVTVLDVEVPKGLVRLS